VASYVTTCLGCGKPRPKGLRAVAGAGARQAEARVIVSPRRGWAVALASWAYAAAVLVVLGLIRWAGDSWWGVPVLLFMPRWLLLAPPLALAAVSALVRCPWHWVLQGATALVVAGPLMDLNVPLEKLWDRPPAGEHIRVATFNMGMFPVRTGAFTRWVEANRVDILCFQEGVRDDPTLVAYLAKGWHVNRLRSIASRFPIVAELESLPKAYDTEGRYSSAVDRVKVRTPAGWEVMVVSAHLPTIRPGFERLFAGSPGGLSLHVEWWGREMSRTLGLLADQEDLPMLVGGDFNMPSDDSTMAALRTSFRFAFEEAGWGYGYTRPARYPWMRIDHLLAGPEWVATWCRRGPDFGSDHLPLVAEFILPGSPPAPAAAGRPAPQGPGAVEAVNTAPADRP
jgi:endonuclease/exonuclease/phosphatase family metal-dependent hydrolase